MSVNIYPAHVVEKTVNHADNWNPDSTMNLANANFYSLAEELNLSRMMVEPGHIRVKILKVAMQMHRSSRYHDRLVKLCAQADVLRASHIAFS